MVLKHDSDKAIDILTGILSKTQFWHSGTGSSQAAAIDVNGKRISLSPGMNVTAEIKTGKRRVIEYLFSPEQRGLSESLGER